jgi:hypothetical protein
MSTRDRHDLDKINGCRPRRDSHSKPDAKTVTGLPNGNLLVARRASNQVVEVNRKGQVIWEYKAQSPFRARIR